MAVVQIKICGMRRAEEVEVAVEAGADLLGFNFWPGTSRYIPPEDAAPLIRAVPSHVSTVGVFVDETPERVLEIAAQTGVSALQFHGSETPEYFDRLGSWRKIKAFKVRNDFEPAELRRYASAYAFLLDGWVAGGLPGGTGRVFDWSHAERAKAYGKIILAGGLNAKNVGEAIRKVEPWGVDVCSGVEIAPGRKTPELIREFIRAAREAEQQLVSSRLESSTPGRQKQPQS